jgi:5'-methylthioadenosine phosphorylase
MLAVIGGTGFYRMDGVKVMERREVATPFGAPSAPLIFAECEGQTALFLPRHGERHQFLPSEINYRANIWALKEAGARQIIAVSACGSLREEIKPGDFAVPTQYFDWTRGKRVGTFFGDGLIAHVSTARSVCPDLSAAIVNAAKELNYAAHSQTTFAVVEGPRLGTRAESFFLRDAACADIVGMTNIPEVFLAREAQICYATLAIVTDYDCWKEDPAHDVTVAMVIKRFGESLTRAHELLTKKILNAPPPPINEKHRRALDEAVLTPADAQSEEHKKILAVLGA